MGTNIKQKKDKYKIYSYNELNKDLKILFNLT